VSVWSVLSVIMCVGHRVSRVGTAVMKRLQCVAVRYRAILKGKLITLFRQV
jgi:hypothetical protein